MWRRFKPKHQPTKHGDSRKMLKLLDNVDRAYDFTQNLKTQTLPKEQWTKADKYHMQLIAQTPRAVLAQRQMDAHKHGFHNREKRLYELIDFNDNFVNYILALPEHELSGAVDKLKKDMKKFCKRLHTPMFSDEQFEAIVHGLSMEIAVYRGAIKEGFIAEMTSRTDDAFGIDMVIRERETGRHINIDCKTPRAFHYRIDDFVKHGRMSYQQADEAEADDFVTLINQRGGDTIPVTTVCIRPERLGKVKNFSFSDTRELAGLLYTMLARAR